METIVLAMVVLSPWAFGSVDEEFESLLLAGVALLTMLWGIRVLVEGPLPWRRCSVSASLFGLILLGCLQVVPFSRPTLAWLSPSTARLYGELLPSQPEVLPYGVPHDQEATPPGSTISVSASASRKEIIRLLALFLLFAAVHNNVASGAAMRRLSVAAVANGSLLALFGLVQSLSSSRSMVYWSYEVPGSSVFGPFINHNHYAFYINLCFGLGLGLVARRQFRLRGPHEREEAVRSRNEPRRGAATAGVPPRRHDRLVPLDSATIRRLLDTEALAINLALALIVGSLALSLSRGGMLAFVGGILACLAIRLLDRTRGPGFGTALTLSMLVPALLAWLGTGRLVTRIAALGESATYQEDRIQFWSGALPLVKQFPIWGTGYGTFRDVEPLHRAAKVDPRTVVSHAHNEYLESLVEGGVFRLALVVLLAWAVYRCCIRAIRALRRRSSRGLAVGALFTLTTVTIHNVCDFGLHVPAISVLTIAVVAQVCRLANPAEDSPGRRRPGKDAASTGAEDGSLSGPSKVRRRGVARVTGLLAFVPALVLLADGWRLDRVQRLRMEALGLLEQGGRAALERRLGVLETAGRLAPDVAYLQAELGGAHLDLFEHRLKQCRRRERLLERCRDVVAGFIPSPIHHRLWQVACAVPERFLRDQHDRLATGQLLPALMHYLRARDLCPFLPEPQIEIAAHREAFERADPRQVYLERAKRVAPTDARLWFVYGNVEISDGETDRACQSWRRSLEYSAQYLPEILDQAAAGSLGPEQLLARVLPEQPELLVAAAAHLSSGRGGEDRRRAFLARAEVLLDRKADRFDEGDFQLKASIQSALGKSAEAIETYKSGLLRAPLRNDWRYALAVALHDRGLFEESAKELHAVLSSDPGHDLARALLNQLAARGFD